MDRAKIPLSSSRYGNWAFILLMVLSTVGKVWLDAALRINAKTGQDFDDALYVRLAYSIADGKWLGDYNAATLSKMPFYPVFLAFNYILGLPLLVTQSLLYALAAIFLLYQLRRHGVGKPYLSGLYLLLLFNPYVETRVMREGIYSTLMVCVFAGYVGMHRYLLSNVRRLAGYSVLSGLFLSLFWLTREESAWLGPAVVLLSVHFGATILMRAQKGRPARWAIVVLPFAILVLAVHALCLTNYRHYGVYQACDQISKPFTTAVGALFRVKHSRRIPHLLVPEEARERIYTVSPAFRELKPYLDGESGSVALRNNWKESTCRIYPETCSDYGGAWVVWALRLAVADAGYYRSSASASAYYRRLSTEINDACDRGVLEGLSARDSLVPPYRPEYTARLIRTYFKAIRCILRVPVRDYVYDPYAVSGGEEEGLAAFRLVTGNKVLPLSTGSADGFTATEMSKLRILSNIMAVYKHVFRVVVWAGFLAYLVTAGLFLRRRRLSFLFVLSSSVLVAAAFRLLALSYIDITLFPAFTMWPAYIEPLYPLSLIFAGVAVIDLKDALCALRPTRLERPSNGR